MNREHVITEMCGILGLAYRSIGDYSHSCDGFCEKCQAQGLSYSNSGKIVEYVRLAVLEKLKSDGHSIDLGFDLETGKDRFAESEVFVPKAT